jgi:hypothetical protein
MTRRSTVAVFVVVSFLIGSVFGWCLRGTHAEKERGSIVVVDAIGVAGLCADALGAAEEGRTATLQKLLEMRMTSAVNEAAERVGAASSPGFAVPNLVEGLNRARRYAVAKGMREVVGKCDRLIEFLTKGNGRG